MSPEVLTINGTLVMNTMSTEIKKPLCNFVGVYRNDMYSDGM